MPGVLDRLIGWLTVEVPQGPGAGEGRQQDAGHAGAFADEARDEREWTRGSGAGRRPAQTAPPAGRAPSKARAVVQQAPAREWLPSGGWVDTQQAAAAARHGSAGEESAAALPEHPGPASPLSPGNGAASITRLLEAASGIGQSLADWFTLEDDRDPASRRPGGTIPLLAAVAGCVVLAGGVLLAAHGSRAPVRRSGPAVPSAVAIATGQANMAAAQAQAAAADAETGSRTVADLVAPAQQAAALVASRSAAALARQPSAPDPGQSDAQLQDIAAKAESALVTIRSDAASAAAAAAATAQASVAPAAGKASAAAASSRAAMAAAQRAAATISALLAPAKTQVQAWAAIHRAPPGSLSLAVADPPAAWGMHGCEVRSVTAGGAGQQLGLVGSDRGAGSVGDIITMIVDVTDSGASWPIQNCADLQAGMAQSRSGDRITVSYEHRVTFDVVLGMWQAGTGTVVLGAGAVCPAPISGRGAMTLKIAIGGPGGTQPAVTVALQPQGAATFFPDGTLRALGYTPVRSESGTGLVPGSQARVNLYQLPGAAITAAGVPLADGVLTVVGIPGGQSSALGPNVFQQGSRLSAAGGGWTLTPPCH